MITCRTYTIEKAPTPGFLLTADQYEFVGEGTFNTTLHISYIAGANKVMRIVNSDPITGDSCLSTDITLDVSGNKDVAYSITGTHIIYVILKLGTDNHDCCTDFNTTTCQYSNYVRFDVIPPTLASIEISSQATSINAGDTLQFTVICKDTNNNVMICPALTWNSTNTSIGTIGPTGLFTGISQGATDITASSGNIISNIVTITVTPAPITLTIITISAPSTSVPIGNTLQFTAVCKDQNNQVMNCPTLTWDVTDITVGSITNSGLFIGSSAGTVTVTARSGSIIGSEIISVTSAAQVITTIDTSPSSVTIAIGNTQQFTAICRDQNNIGMTCPTVTWSTTDITIGTINSSGLFTAIAEGTVTVRAISGTVIGTSVVTVGVSPPGVIVGDITIGLNLLGKNMIWAASVLGIAIVGAVVSYKGYKEKEIEKQAEIAKKAIEGSIEMERIREREMGMLSKK